MTLVQGLEEVGSDPSAATLPAGASSAQSDPRAASMPTITPDHASTSTAKATSTAVMTHVSLRRRPRTGEERAQIAVRFTIALVITAILATLSVLPGTQSTREAIEAERQSTELRLTLAELRATIADYHATHEAFPGTATSSNQDSTSLEHDLDVAYRRTRIATAGAMIDLSGPHAPRVEGTMLENPLNHRSSVRYLNTTEPWPLVGDDSTGWIYRPASGEIRANSTGTSPWSGNRFIDM